ncbi:hypothetical protein QUA07_23130 [Microcoleus sp. T3_A4]
MSINILTLFNIHSQRWEEAIAPMDILTADDVRARRPYHKSSTGETPVPQ